MPTETDTSQAALIAAKGVQAFQALLAASAATNQPWAAQVAAVEAAIQASNAQVAALKAALRSHEDSEVAEIAALGFDGLNGGHKVALKDALAALGQSSGDGLAGAKAAALAAVNAFKAHIAADEAIAILDDNPFGVKVSISGGVGAALAALATALA